MKVVNSPDLPPEQIVGQMNELRPLPTGRQEFEDWTERLIAGAMVPGQDISPAFIESQKVALAHMVLHLGPHDDHKPDIYFIKALRKGVINQVVHSYVEEVKARRKAEEEKAKLAQVLATAQEQLGDFCE